MKIIGVGMADSNGDLALMGDLRPDCVVVIIEKEDGETTKDIVEKIKELGGKS